MRAAIPRDSREDVNSSIFSHGYRINVSWPLAVLEENGTVVRVLCPWNVDYPLIQHREIPCLVPAVVIFQFNSGYIIDDLFQFGDSIRNLVVIGYFTPIFSQVSNWTASSSTLEGMESSVLPRSTATLKPYSASRPPDGFDLVGWRHVDKHVLDANRRQMGPGGVLELPLVYQPTSQHVVRLSPFGHCRYIGRDK